MSCLCVFYPKRGYEVWMPNCAALGTEKNPRSAGKLNDPIILLCPLGTSTIRGTREEPEMMKYRKAGRDEIFKTWISCLASEYPICQDTIMFGIFIFWHETISCATSKVTRWQMGH